MKANREKIRIAIAGYGNCAIALAQVIYYLIATGKILEGVMHRVLGGYSMHDVEIVCIFDVDKNKVGRDASEAVYAGPNCTERICDIPYLGVKVSLGPILDGVSPRMEKYFSPCEAGRDENKTIEQWKKEVVEILVKSKAQILLNYMPVGSDFATAFYAECALEAGCAFINCMPSFICSVPAWAERFTKAGLPIIGDDIKSQVGASILNRYIARLFDVRGSKIDLIYQHNRGNNTDFFNMQDAERLKTKYVSKRHTVTSNIDQDPEFDLEVNGIDETLIGDHKVCDLKFRSIICGTHLTFDGRLEVVDSYNSAGCVIDAIRIARIALDRGIVGPILPACAFLMKSPPVQMDDLKAAELVEDFVSNDSRTIIVPHSRIRDFCQSGQKFSEFWTNVMKIVCENARAHGIRGVKIMAPKKFYHDQKEFVELIEAAIKELMSYPSGYDRNLIIPFSITNLGLKKRLIEVLKQCPEINVYGINVPPDNEYLSQLSNICGYAGLEEYDVGKNLYHALIEKNHVSKILVLRHQSNAGLEMRIGGILEEAAKDGRDVIIVNSHQHRRIRSILSTKDVGVITLGCRGTEALLNIKSEEKVPFVCMDRNERIEEAVKNSNAICVSSFIHENIYGGVVFSGIIEVIGSPQIAA